MEEPRETGFVRQVTDRWNDGLAGWIGISALLLYGLYGFRLALVGLGFPVLRGVALALGMVALGAKLWRRARGWPRESGRCGE